MHVTDDVHRKLSGVGLSEFLDCIGANMKARFMIEAPDEIEATMKITMSVKEWTDLRDQLQQKWPSGRLQGAITDLLAQARKVYYAEHGAA